jgi:hypothetical protein
MARMRQSAPRAKSPQKVPASASLAVEAGLRRELAAAKARIAELEKGHRDLARRIESAIAAIHKLLDA